MPNHFRSTERQDVPDVEPLNAPAPVRAVTASTDLAPMDGGRAEGHEGSKGSQSLYASLEGEGAVVPHTGTPTISLQNVTVIYPAQPNKPA